MIGLDKIKNMYFLGIGGIGMSSLARYFNHIGKVVAGYDLTETALTSQLCAEGIAVHYDDSVTSIPAFLNEDDTLVIYTPALPNNHIELNWLKNKGFITLKRAQVLGEICNPGNCIAVAGTHGKTTVTTILSVILNQTDAGCGAFLGGISNNFNSNLVLPRSENGWLVTEADEFDRSFLNLKPNIALITSIDADHLDIYGDYSHLLKSFQQFVAKIKPEGILVVKKGIELGIPENEDLKVYSYSLSEKADFYASDIKIVDGLYKITLSTPMGNISGITISHPGLINVENAVAASALALLAGASHEDIKSGLLKFVGVKRRFDIRYKSDELVFIDDYAHHPEELKAVINSVKQLYPGKKVAGIFQPHLFSRTQDFADEFATSLDLLDEVALLPIYPAREEPVEGVNSKLILDKIQNKNKILLQKNEVIDWIKNPDRQIIMTLGAGDIDVVANKIAEELRR